MFCFLFLFSIQIGELHVTLSCQLCSHIKNLQLLWQCYWLLLIAIMHDWTFSRHWRSLLYILDRAYPDCTINFFACHQDQQHPVLEATYNRPPLQVQRAIPKCQCVTQAALLDPYSLNNHHVRPKHGTRNLHFVNILYNNMLEHRQRFYLALLWQTHACMTTRIHGHAHEPGIDLGSI